MKVSTILLVCIITCFISKSLAKKKCDDGTKPTCADGEKPMTCADGSTPAKGDGRKPKCEDGSKPTCADGGKPMTCADGSTPSGGGGKGGRGWCPKSERVCCDGSAPVEPCSSGRPVCDTETQCNK